MSARVTFQDLSRSFRRGRATTVALANINLTMEPGSFTAIVGPSGCGKSTLLHIAAGLDTGYQGRFERGPSDAVVACLFQQPRLLPWLTAWRNVAFVLEGRGVDKATARGRAEEMLRLVGLSAAAEKFPAELSGGMQQRVALARALAVDPDLLLMDEPFSALDELTAAQLRAELLALYAGRQRTVLFITHNIREAAYLADRVVVLSPNPGSVIADIPVTLPRPREPESPHLAEIAGHILGFVGRSRTPQPEAMDA